MCSTFRRFRYPYPRNCILYTQLFCHFDPIAPSYYLTSSVTFDLQLIPAFARCPPSCDGQSRRLPRVARRWWGCPFVLHKHSHPTRIKGRVMLSHRFRISICCLSAYHTGLSWCDTKFIVRVVKGFPIQ